jgi:hypothetical protein
VVAIQHLALQIYELRHMIEDISWERNHNNLLIGVLRAVKSCNAFLRFQEGSLQLVGKDFGSIFLHYEHVVRLCFVSFGVMRHFSRKKTSLVSEG